MRDVGGRGGGRPGQGVWNVGLSDSGRLAPRNESSRGAGGLLLAHAGRRDYHRSWHNFKKTAQSHWDRGFFHGTINRRWKRLLHGVADDWRGGPFVVGISHEAGRQDVGVMGEECDAMVYGDVVENDRFDAADV